MFSIACADYAPKPNRDAYDRFVERFAIEPKRAAMFEDMTRNLEVPHAMGFETVLVRTAKDWSHEPEAARPARCPDQRRKCDHPVPHRGRECRPAT